MTTGRLCMCHNKVLAAYTAETMCYELSRPDRV